MPSDIDGMKQRLAIVKKRRNLPPGTSIIDIAVKKPEKLPRKLMVKGADKLMKEVNDSKK